MNNSIAPIGIFDSGLGGLSIWKSIKELLPKESLIYYADQANIPYGQKSTTELQDYSLKIVKFLLDKGCKMIVVACNTATAASIDLLRERFPKIPFVGIEPAVKPAAEKSQTGHIGVLATQSTLQSELFYDTKERFASGVEVHAASGTFLVELIENGDLKNPKLMELLKSYVQPMLDDNIDHLVLGCTHYPFLIPLLKEFVPENVKVINPAPAVAIQIERLLYQNNLIGEGPAHYEFFTSGNASVAAIGIKALLEINANVTSIS